MTATNRETWKSRKDFLLACIGNCVGLGNIWRFPYLLYESGGAVFLLPYFVMLFLVGIPLLYMEIAVGIITERGATASMKALCPSMKGVGYGSVILSFFYAGYFTTIISYILYYLAASLTFELPWSEENQLFANLDENETRPTSKIYFDEIVLQKSSSISDFGSLRPELVLALLATWIIIYFCIFRGTAWIGKVIHFTAIMPYIILVALAVRGLTLPGAGLGVQYLLGLRGETDWSLLLTAKPWVTATAQTFGSIGIAYGSMIHYSALNDKKASKDIFRDTFIIAIVNSLTSVAAAFIIFAVVGNISFTTGTPIKELGLEGMELVFVSYPRALAKIPFGPVWSVLFFLSLFLLGLDSVFASVEVVIGAISEKFGHKKWCVREKITLYVCAVLCLLTLPNMFQGGIYFFKLVDWYTCTTSTFFIGLAEVITVIYFYGVDNLTRDLKNATGYETQKYLKLLLKFVSPVLVAIITAIKFNDAQPIKYGDVEYPAWCVTFGQLLSFVSISSVPIGFIHQIWSSKNARQELFGVQKSQLYGLLTFEIKNENLMKKNDKRVDSVYDITLIE